MILTIYVAGFIVFTALALTFESTSPKKRTWRDLFHAALLGAVWPLGIVIVILAALIHILEDL